MYKIITTFCLLLSLIMLGCTGKPSDEAIKKKILLEYVCMETAEVNDLRILNSKEAETVSDAKGYEYTVSGEVVWKDGCKEFGSGTPPGFKERFENKKIYLVSIDGEWR